MMPTFLVTMLVDASWIMPVNADGLLDGNGGNESCKADRETTEQKFDQALTVSSHLWGESPGFVSTKARIRIDNRRV